MKTPQFLTRRPLPHGATLNTRWPAGFLFGAIMLGSPALAVTWTGSSGTNWNTAANWGGTLPDNTSAVINSASPVATISANFTVTPTFILIANGAGITGRVDHLAGIGNTAASQDIQIGRAGGNGTYNLANTAAAGGTLTGFGQGSGTMNVLRHLYVGGFTSGAAATGTVNIHTSGTLAIGSQLLVGNSLGTGLVKMDSGTMTVVDAMEIGNGPSTIGTLNQSGGTITKSGAATAVTIGGGVTTDGGTGTANLTGGTFTTAGVFRVGQDTITASATTSNGTLNLGGTALTVNGEFWVGNNTGATGIMNFSSGSLTTNNWALVGRKDDTNTGVGATGTVNMTGGTWTKTGENNFVVGDTGPGTMSMTGGLVIVTPHTTADRGITWIANRNNCTGTLTLSGSSEFRSSRFVLAVQSGTTGTLNLNGGTVKTSQISGGGGTDAVHFNGSQIVATANQDFFIDSLDTASLDAGGLRVDSNGFNVKASQAFAGTGGVIKTGAGTLSLTGANIYTGNHTVSAGKLAVSTDSTGIGNFTVAAGAAMGVIQSSGTATLAVADVTLGTTGTSSLDIDLGNNPGNPSAPALDVTHALTINGSVKINIADLAPVAGPAFPLIRYATPKLGTGSITLGNLPNGVSAILTDDNNGLISLEITTIHFPKWTGAQSAVWNTSTVNWKDLLTLDPLAYTDPLPVLFDDDITGPSAVTLDQTVSPSDVKFNNSTAAYSITSITGTGKITGTTGLTKEGSADLTLGTANEYTGVTTLSGGAVFLNSIANAGSPSSIGAASAAPSNLVLNGSSLNYTGPAATSDRGFTINATGTVISNANDLAFGGQVLTSAGNLTKAGAGNLTLSHNGANVIGTVNQGIRVDAGTLTLSGAGAQTNTVAGEMWVADLPDIQANLVLNNTSLTIASWLAISRGNGDSGVTNLTATNSTISCVNFSTGYNNGLANNASEAFVTLNNTVWTNSGLTYLAESTGSAATMLMNGNSQYNINNNFLVARLGTATATVTLSDTSKITKTGGYTAIGNEGVGTMTVKDSAAFTATTGDFNVGDVGSSNGTLNLNGSATMNVTNVYIGKNSGTTGTMNQTGGSFQSGSFITIGSVSGGNGTANLTGGTFTSTTELNVGATGVGTLNVSGTSVVTSNGTGVVVGSGVGGVGTLNLNGGTVLTKRLAENTGGASTVRFNGGLLKAAAGANTTFLGPIDTVTIQSGGAFIDTNGQTLSATALLSGTGSLTKSGAGTLTLSGANTYSGNTTVSAGTLSATTAFFANASTITISSGAVLNLPHGAIDIVAGLVINGTPLAAGTYNSTTNPTSITGTGQLQVTGAVDTYATWASSFGLNPLTDGARSFDKDGDGQLNGVEFALGGSPISGSNNAKVFELVADSNDVGTEKELLVTIAVRSGTPVFTGSPSPTATQEGATYTVQGSTTLGGFTTVATVANVVAPAAPNATAPSGYEWRTFSLSGSNGTPNKGFLRVMVNQ